jgi:hypothetical protein
MARALTVITQGCDWCNLPECESSELGGDSVLSIQRGNNQTTLVIFENALTTTCSLSTGRSAALRRVTIPSLEPVLCS